MARVKIKAVISWIVLREMSAIRYDYNRAAVGLTEYKLRLCCAAQRLSPSTTLKHP